VQTSAGAITASERSRRPRLASSDAATRRMAVPYEIVHDRVLAYGWRRYLGGRGPLRAALGLAQSLS